MSVWYQVHWFECTLRNATLLITSLWAAFWFCLLTSSKTLSITALEECTGIAVTLPTKLNKSSVTLNVVLYSQGSHL